MKTRTVRRITVLAAAGATAFAAPALATAEPIDIQPIPIGCPAGIGSVETETVLSDDDAAVGQIEYEIEEEGSSGGQIAWINLAALDFGTGAFDVAEEGEEPAAVLETGAGLVASAVWGAHENSAGESCFLLPGLDLTDVPAAGEGEGNGDDQAS